MMFHSRAGKVDLEETHEISQLSQSLSKQRARTPSKNSRGKSPSKSPPRPSYSLPLTPASSIQRESAADPNPSSSDVLSALVLLQQKVLFLENELANKNKHRSSPRPRPPPPAPQQHPPPPPPPPPSRSIHLDHIKPPFVVGINQSRPNISTNSSFSSSRSHSRLRSPSPPSPPSNEPSHLYLHTVSSALKARPFSPRGNASSRPATRRSSSASKRSSNTSTTTIRSTGPYAHDFMDKYLTTNSTRVPSSRSTITVSSPNSHLSQSSRSAGQQVSKSHFLDQVLESLEREHHELNHLYQRMVVDHDSTGSSVSDPESERFYMHQLADVITRVNAKKKQIITLRKCRDDNLPSNSDHEDDWLQENGYRKRR